MSNVITNLVDLEKFLSDYQVLDRKIGSHGEVYIAESSEKTISELAGLRAKILVLDIYDPKECEEKNE